MCYGENMPLDVLFVRDDDIPDLVQEDVCDLGLVGLERASRRSAWSSPRAAIAPLFETVRTLDFGRCRLCSRCRTAFDYRRRRSRCRASASRPPIRTSWRAFSRARHRRRDRGAVRLGRDRAAARPRGSDLRSGLDRLDAGRRITCAQAQTVLESHAVLIRTPVPIAAGKAGMGAPAADAHRRRASRSRAASTSCCTRRAPRCRRSRSCCRAARRRPSFRSRACGDRVAVHAVCRENVFWETLESLKGAGASSVLVLPVEKMLA